MVPWNLLLRKTVVTDLTFDTRTRSVDIRFTFTNYVTWFKYNHFAFFSIRKDRCLESVFVKRDLSADFEETLL